MDKKIIEEWLKNNGYGYGYGSGYGSGDGSGDGYGYGYGYGDGSGSGYGSGDGSGYGSGSGYGYGYGYGSGSGYGSGDGYGYGYGSGYGIVNFNDYDVFQIDGVNTIITNIKGNFAKGYILNADFTLEKTYVAKGNGYFAHGSTIKESAKALQDKLFEDLDIEEKIAEFKKQFKKDQKYKGTLFFEWHHHLTGSCLQGRKSFIQDKGLDVNADYLVIEFLNIVKDSFGWGNLEELVDYYK